MYIFANSPVRDISFGQALKLSLDSYYDLLKGQVASLQADEFLQLKLVADMIDLSLEEKASKGGYVWYSYHNLLERSDVAIEPKAVSDSATVGLELLSDIYGRFLRRLRKYAIAKELTPQEQLHVHDIENQIDALKKECDGLVLDDRARWEKIAPAMGYSVGDWTAYRQWSNMNGSIRKIQEKYDKIRKLTFDKKTILNRQYPDAADKEIIDAEFDYDNPMTKLRYPIWPDYTYPEGDSFSPSYLSGLGGGSTALFADRYVAKFGQTLKTIKRAGTGTLVGSLDKQTAASTSITTDWSASGSGSYGFISANVSASEHRQIQEDFKKGVTINVGAASASRVGVTFPSWFKPTLFKHKHVTDNPHDFLEFFGEKGSLRYYPTALIVVRGFSIEFISTQAWTYDYDKRFSASGGGGFSSFGISFGSSASYSSHIKEHQVDTSNTTLKFYDDADTVRFVGYAVKKNDVLSSAIENGVRGLGI